MFFCENDGNMLRKKIKDQKKLIYYCMLCEAEYDVDEINEGGNKKNQNCIFKHNYNSNNLSYQTYVNENIFHDKTLPRINLKCINEECPSNKEGKPREVISIKYNQEDMLYVYACCHCKKVWTNSSLQFKKIE
tara:strand:- start:1424 stop:1822 length:399 start_codon:yes stop_codon:yes gene_type:complete